MTVQSSEWTNYLPDTRSKGFQFPVYKCALNSVSHDMAWRCIYEFGTIKSIKRPLFETTVISGLNHPFGNHRVSLESFFFNG